MTLHLDGSTIEIDAVVAVARDGEQVQLGDDVLARLATARQGIEAMVTSGQPVYGVSTGLRLARHRRTWPRPTACGCSSR